jgi:hypothetical protein
MSHPEIWAMLLIVAVINFWFAIIYARGPKR